MKIAAMLRVRNEARWIAEVLASIQPLTRDILIFDDHSTDDTRDICERMGATVTRSPFPVGDTNESRDKNAMLDIVRASNPEWVLAIDGDEVLERDSAARIRQRLIPGVCVLSFPVKYLWNDRRHYRVDGVYGHFQRASMFQLQPQARYAATRNGGNFHCGNIPANLKGSGAAVPSDLLHLGYMEREDRVRKFAWYNQVDPGNGYEDQYRHMVLGDLPEYPAEMKRVHGGPLKIFTLPASKWPTYESDHTTPTSQAAL